MKNMLGKKKILEISHNSTGSQSLAGSDYSVESNVLSVLNTALDVLQRLHKQQNPSSNHSCELVIEFFKM